MAIQFITILGILLPLVVTYELILRLFEWAIKAFTRGTML